MDVKCEKCEKVHSLPPNLVDNKKVYFYCTSCGHRIIVDNRKDSSEPLKLKETLTIRDIFDGVSGFLNITNVLISVVYSLVTTIMVIFTAGLMLRFVDYFYLHPVAAVITVSFLVLLMYYLYNIVLYIVSKVYFFQIRNEGLKRLTLKYMTFDLKDDYKTIFIATAGIFLIFIVIILPAYFMNVFGIVYSGFFIPVLLACAFLVMLLLVLKNYVPAIIASRSGFVSDGLKELFFFLCREFRQLPFHFIAVRIVYKFFSLVIWFFFFSALALSFFFSLMAQDPVTKYKLYEYFASLAGGGGISSLSSVQHIPSVSIGIMAFAFFLYVFFILIWSVMLNLKQSLVVRSVHIMQNNPGNSVGPGIMMFFMAAMMFVVIMISVIFILLMSNFSSLSALFK